MWLDRLRAIRDGAAPGPPIADLVGFAVTAVEPGEVVIEMDADTRHHNPTGTLHGGIYCTIADTAMGMAYASMLDEGETFTTLELSIHFLRPYRVGHLRAVGRVVKRGRTIGLTECDVLDGHGNLVARSSSTCITLRGEQAVGR